MYIYIYIKNFAWEDQRRKWCYMALRGVSSAILSVYITGYAYARTSRLSKGFPQPFRCWINSKVLTKPVLSGFDVSYRQSHQPWDG